MEWTSLTHLIADLRLSAPETEVEGLRREIKQRMHLAHPDHSGGHFATAAQETEYLRLAGALEYLDSLPSSLTTVDGLGTVRAELTEIRTLVTRTLEATRATATTDWRRVSRAEARSEMLVPRLSSAAIGGLALGLLAAGDRLNRVVPGELITSPLFRILLLMLVVGALALWALTWMAEQRFASRCDNLATVDGRQRLLNWVTDWGSTNEFRFSDLTTAIQSMLPTAKPMRGMQDYPLPSSLGLVDGRRSS